MCSTNILTSPVSNALSNHLHNNAFLPGFSSSAGWHLLTRTPGAWCRFRGYWSSRPRHLSPRSRICAQEWHCKDIHSHSQSHTPVHTPQKRKRKSSTDQAWCLRFPVHCGGGRRPGSLAPAPHDCLMSEAFSSYDSTDKTFVDVFNKYSNIARQQCPF